MSNRSGYCNSGAVQEQAMLPAPPETGSPAQPQDWPRTVLGAVLSAWSGSVLDSLCLVEPSLDGLAWGRGSLSLRVSAIPSKPA